MMTAKTSNLIFLVCMLPLIGLAETLSISLITNLLREPSDMAVLAGVAAACLFLFANYKLVLLTFKYLKH